MLIKANQSLYASKGALNEALFQLTGKSFMIAVTTNVKQSDLGTVPMLERHRSIDDLLTSYQIRYVWLARDTIACIFPTGKT